MQQHVTCVRCITIFLKSLTCKTLNGSRNCLCVFPKMHLLLSFSDHFKRGINDDLIIFCFNLCGLGDEKTTVGSTMWLGEKRDIRDGLLISKVLERSVKSRESADK